MGAVNYMQRIGHESCLRCEFETRDDMTFAEQDYAMHTHLAEKHPDWMIDGGASILPHRMPSWKPSTMYQVGDVVTISNVGSTVHEAGCTCGFCRLGSTRA